jgi:hypothetical protein
MSEERARLLEALATIVITIREEQVSAKMGFGTSSAEKRRRADTYAAEIARQSRKIDDVLDALAALEPCVVGKLK